MTGPSNVQGTSGPTPVGPRPPKPDAAPPAAPASAPPTQTRLSADKATARAPGLGALSTSALGLDAGMDAISRAAAQADASQHRQDMDAIGTQLHEVERLQSLVDTKKEALARTLERYGPALTPAQYKDMLAAYERATPELAQLAEAQEKLRGMLDQHRDALAADYASGANRSVIERSFEAVGKVHGDASLSFMTSVMQKLDPKDPAAKAIVDRMVEKLGPDALMQQLGEGAARTPNDRLRAAREILAGPFGQQLQRFAAVSPNAKGLSEAMGAMTGPDPAGAIAAFAKRNAGGSTFQKALATLDLAVGVQFVAGAMERGDFLGVAVQVFNDASNFSQGLAYLKVASAALGTFAKFMEGASGVTAVVASGIQAFYDLQKLHDRPNDTARKVAIGADVVQVLGYGTGVVLLAAGLPGAAIAGAVGTAGSAAWFLANYSSKIAPRVEVEREMNAQLAKLIPDETTRRFLQGTDPALLRGLAAMGMKPEQMQALMQAQSPLLQASMRGEDLARLEPLLRQAVGPASGPMDGQKLLAFFQSLSSKPSYGPTNPARMLGDLWQDATNHHPNDPAGAMRELRARLQDLRTKAPEGAPARAVADAVLPMLPPA